MEEIKFKFKEGRRVGSKIKFVDVGVSKSGLSSSSPDDIICLFTILSGYLCNDFGGLKMIVDLLGVYFTLLRSDF